MSWESFRQQLPKGYSTQDLELIGKAYGFADQAHEGVPRASGEPYMVHPEAVALILADLRLDAPTLAAALLHDVVEDTNHKLAKLAELFGAEVADLVDGVTKLAQIDKTANVPTDSRDPKLESLRKMFLAMANDVRVILIKLADRLHNMRTIGYLPPEKQRRISRETLDVYARLANVLGIFRIKWELEDLAFRCLEPDTYAQIGRSLNQRRIEREVFVRRVLETLQPELEKMGIQAEISGRPKHIYSIWRKMMRKGVTLEEIYDQEGVRVVTPTVGDCYAALGIVHHLWRPIPGEFDDYIANPKENQYQSLHTAVIGPEGQPLEIQIRTTQMHRVSEVGIAAHWRYKTEGRRDEMYEQKIAWLRSVIEWKAQEHSTTDEFMTTIREELFKDRVYVFTPKGDVIDLPIGATPIDFAYQVHTEVGHRCRGARVNNRQVGLDFKLSNGDRVEIITIKRGGPSHDWINPNLGFTASTPRATKSANGFSNRTARRTSPRAASSFSVSWRAWAWRT